MFPAAVTIEADDLAKRALKAATQLDRMERHKPANVDAINEFIDALVCLSDTPGAIGFSMSLGPMSSEMLSAAVQSATSHRVTTTEMLSQELQKITTEMRQSTQNGAHGSALQHLKAFSLFIHEFIQRNKAVGGVAERGVFDYDYSFAS
ncbi:hypothetical protein [Agrobacterium pusense]|uniref:hypothetical protein n=1 Tax=Agrobacterium pusense TaxID=648995 RepID=UPI000DD8D431|nr:hypothetical protein [Agrobacterium pusense]MCZ7930341.1 hypothetical protein [Agrobacterium pusense]